MKLFLIILFAVAGVYIFFESYRRSKKNGFYGNTTVLNIFSVYVWGDGLLIGPFWTLSSILFIFLDLEWIIRYIVLFFLFRSAVEIIYWINHQVAQRDYIPPLFSKVTWLKANESAILYQLKHTMITVVLTFYLLYSFNH